VGINDYPNLADRLEGCVNGVFEMSAVLQELGFDPSNIRVMLNEGATAQGVKERLHWLLEGARPEDLRMFY
jgi:arylamine N-acetyltransferase